ncbi:WD40-repeat-containing domain protein [Suillus discolor]|uniref:WD40-repeat-containing domain protein n=1 Tax=Suillus discolor TaxID=1912936 RepID=A0A9P7ESW3_9AGAM|nr:WD40-repeat-containing domain protein [Suillus discolor]KAG2087457.1 WD40-repeat-containing domain protein [Suillus discolor]
MASTTTKAAAMKSILTPSITFEGHGGLIRSISYLPDGEQIISGSQDKTVRRWDLKACGEIKSARRVSENDVWVVAVSGNGRWVVAAGGDWNSTELKVCEVETGIVKTFEGHSNQITCIDISADSTLLATGAKDFTVRIWNLDTGKLVAGPFESVAWVGAVRFSQDSKKLAVRLDMGTCLEVWDVQKQKLDVRIGKLYGVGVLPGVPVFWTNKNKNILTAFTFTVDVALTIYEFDASTLPETVGASFEGHTDTIESLALSFDCTFLASASSDNTIKLWAFESRQLLASFDAYKIHTLIFSPNSHQLAYTTHNKDDYKIYISTLHPTSLLRLVYAFLANSTLNDLLHSDATRRPPAGRLRQPISVIPRPQRPPPTIDSQQPAFVRIRKLLHFSSRTNVTPPAQPRNPLDVPATLPLPSSLSGQTATRFDHFEMSSPPHPSNRVTQFLRQRLSFLVPRHSLVPPVVEVAPGRKVTRLAAAKLPEYKKVDDTRHPSSQQATMPQENDSTDIDSLPDVHWCKAFLCYYSCWSHGRLRMPPRWRLERVDVPRQGDTANSSHTGAHGRS